MNTQINLAAARTKLANVAALAEQHRALAAAATEAERLEAEIADLEERAAKEADRDAAAAKAIGKYRNLRISPRKDQDMSGHPAMLDYLVQYERTVSDALTMQPVEVSEAAPLLSCSLDLYAAVLAQPEVLPLAIRLLAETPDAAVRAHAAHKRRGYMTGPSVAQAVTGPVHEQPDDTEGFTSYTPGTHVPGVRFE